MHPHMDNEESRKQWNVESSCCDIFELRIVFFRVNRINKFHDAVLLLRDIH